MCEGVGVWEDVSVRENVSVWEEVGERECIQWKLCKKSM